MHLPRLASVQPYRGIVVAATGHPWSAWPSSQPAASRNARLSLICPGFSGRLTFYRKHFAWGLDSPAEMLAFA